MNEDNEENKICFKVWMGANLCFTYGVYAVMKISHKCSHSCISVTYNCQA